MSTGEVVSALDHGKRVDRIKGQITYCCDHCGEEINGYSRFKQHLGGIGGEVTPCVKVPEDVKVKISNSLNTTNIAHEDDVDVHGHGTLEDDEVKVHANSSPQRKNETVVDVHDHTLEDDEVKVHANSSPQRKNEAVVDVHDHTLEDEDVKVKETNKPDEHREVPQLFEPITSLKKDSRSDDSDPDEASMNIHDYGTVVDKKKRRVECKYCAKVMSSGYYRLQQHLAGVGTDVLPCVEVPKNIKVQMKKHWRMQRKVRQSSKSSSLGKKNSSSDDSPKQSGNHVKSSQPTLLRKRKRSPIAEYSSESEQEDEDLQPLHYPKTSKELKNAEEAEDVSSKQTQRCVGRFFIENGIDFSAANSSTFQKMIIALVGDGSTAVKVPSCDDLKGWILEEELKAMREYVREVVCSWGNTGCSILLDGWTDDKGQNMINFVVDSPKGPIFMKSADFSDSVGDVDAMVSLLSGVIEEVGVQNVVQIVTYTTEGLMEAVGKQMAVKYKSIFWTVCASHCIGLMLEKIGMLGTESRVLIKAKAITKFIYSHETLLKLMRKHTGGFDLVISSRIRSMVPFLVLERIQSQKNHLRKMVISSEWKGSTLALTADGRMVAGLLSEESSFWTEAEMLVKASTPLIRALDLLNGEDSKPQLGYLYETMKQVKETIKKVYKGGKADYLPFWTVIDGIWFNQLHRSIHAAGYYLNPGLFYFKDFKADDEVKRGILWCFKRIAEDESEQLLIESQFEEYKKYNEEFGYGDAVDQVRVHTPAKWWSLHGGQCPELQRFAMRILSQTCTGALRYGLKRSLTEELHTKGRSRVEQKRLDDLTFVQHNLRLQNLCASDTEYTDVFLEPIDPMDEWIGGGSMEEKNS